MRSLLLLLPFLAALAGPALGEQDRQPQVAQEAPVVRTVRLQDNQAAEAFRRELERWNATGVLRRFAPPEVSPAYRDLTFITSDSVVLLVGDREWVGALLEWLRATSRLVSSLAAQARLAESELVEVTLPIQHGNTRGIYEAFRLVALEDTPHFGLRREQDALRVRASGGTVAAAWALIQALDVPAMELAVWKLQGDVELLVEYPDGRSQRVGALEWRGESLSLTGPLRLTASTGLTVQVRGARLEIDKTEAEQTVLRLRALPAGAAGGS